MASGTKRDLLKTATYGLTHLAVAVAVVYAVTRDWTAALAIGLLEPMVQTVAYAPHERAWSAAPPVEAPAPGVTTDPDIAGSPP